jgi:hypothetical protein
VDGSVVPKVAPVSYEIKLKKFAPLEQPNQDIVLIDPSNKENKPKSTMVSDLQAPLYSLKTRPKGKIGQLFET